MLKKIDRDEAELLWMMGAALIVPYLDFHNRSWPDEYFCDAQLKGSWYRDKKDYETGMLRVRREAFTCTKEKCHCVHDQMPYWQEIYIETDEKETS